MAPNAIGQSCKAKDQLPAGQGKAKAETRGDSRNSANRSSFGTSRKHS